MLASLLVLALIGGQAPASRPAQETLTDVQVQGNLVTPDDEIIALAGIHVGMAVGPRTADDVTMRLRLTRRFKQVEVLKRFASISDPTKVVLVIIVDEGPVRIEMTGDPNRPTRAVRVRGLNLFFLPEFGVDDTYGFTYGGRLAMADVAGNGSRLSFPMSWGGVKHAGIDVEQDFKSGPVSRFRVGAAAFRRERPFFQDDEGRLQFNVQAERQLTRAWRVGAAGGWQQVSFLGERDRFGQVLTHVVFDTRRDPMLARNAVYARIGWEHYRFPGETFNRADMDVRGYVGLFGQNVLVLRGLRQDADTHLPPYLQPMLGGTMNLRGFRPGTKVGDTLMAGSVEARIPLSSPLNLGKMGVSAFVDTGMAYDKGQSFRDQPLEHGYGGGFWFSLSFLQFSVSVGRGSGGLTRAHVLGGATF